MNEIKSLREKLKAKYHEDLKLLDDAEAMFAKRGVVTTPGAEPKASTPKARPGRRKKPSARGGSVRSIILDAISDWASIAALIASTNLKPTQIRGVLNAKDLAARIERRKVGDLLEFKAK